MENTAKAEDWEFKLAMFLNDRVESIFSWGDHDCCLFVADAILEMTGFDVAEFFRGKYSDRESAFESMKEYSGGSVAETVGKICDDNGFKEIPVEEVRMGDIATIRVKAVDPIAHELSNGISIGINIKENDFLSAGRKGLVQSRNPEIVKAWRI